jgi:hypothetical protein
LAALAVILSSTPVRYALTGGIMSDIQNEVLTITEIRVIRIALDDANQAEEEDVERKDRLQKLSDRLESLVSRMMDLSVEYAVLAPLPRIQEPPEEEEEETTAGGFPKHFQDSELLKEFARNRGFNAVRLDQKPEDQPLSDFARACWEEFLQGYTIATSIQESAPKIFQEQLIAGYLQISRKEERNE